MYSHCHISCPSYDDRIRHHLDVALLQVFRFGQFLLLVYRVEISHLLRSSIFSANTVHQSPQTNSRWITFLCSSAGWGSFYDSSSIAHTLNKTRCNTPHRPHWSWLAMTRRILSQISNNFQLTTAGSCATAAQNRTTQQNSMKQCSRLLAGRRRLLCLLFPFGSFLLSCSSCNAVGA